MSILKPFDFLIQWHLTERCNLSCRHCYQDEPRAGELSLSEIKDGIAEISEMFEAWADSYKVSFSPSFNITGGEPLLRHDLFEILSLLRRRGFASYLLTNGTLVDREKARLLSDFDVKGAQVSIEGTEEVHDAIRGAGTFARSVAGVEHLLDAEIKVTLNVTLSRLNAQGMKSILLFASHLGVQRVGFSRLVPAGRGLALASEMLSAAEVGDLYEFLFSRDIRGLELVTGDPVASQMRSQRKKKYRKAGKDGPYGGCSAGVSGLTVLADGTLVPCRRLPVPIGNLRTDSLREVWAMSPVLGALRDQGRYKGKCGSCDRWNNCRGCRAIAYAYSQTRGEGDFLAEDPQCFLAA